MKHSDERIRNLAFGRLSRSESISVQRHIIECPDCLRRLTKIAANQQTQASNRNPLCVRTARKPLYFVHDTADGFIYSKVERRGRKWWGAHWGDQLDGGTECRTMRK